MKVAYWYNNRDIRIVDKPIPKPGPDEILVKIISCGICGSDVVEWYRLPRAPLVPGHEIGAEVVSVGKAVASCKIGDRVFIAPKVPCMQCDFCLREQYPLCTEIKERLPGGFAEYIVVPKSILDNGTYLLPDNVSYDQSTFIEPLACVVRAHRLADVKQGNRIMVFGSGMSGLLHIRLAKSKGCHVITTDINKNRLQLAKTSGADTTLLAAGEVSGYFASGQPKPNVIMLCTGAPSVVEQAWQYIEKGGTIVFFAVPNPDVEVIIPINYFWTREIRVLTSYYCGPPDIKDALKLIESGRICVEDMITHQLPLTEILKGFELVTQRSDSLKVIIKPQLK